MHWQTIYPRVENGLRKGILTECSGFGQIQCIYPQLIEPSTINHILKSASPMTLIRLVDVVCVLRMHIRDGTGV